MDSLVIPTLGLIVLLLVLSAFFSGSETALTAASRPLLHQRALSGDRRAARVNRLRENREQLLGTILIGNNLVNILASVLATTVMLHWFGEAGIVYATAAMTLLVVIFAEVLPKTYAIGHATRMSLAVAPPLLVFVRLFAPLSHLVTLLVAAILRGMGVRRDTRHHTLSEEELRGAIELHGRADVEKHERTMLHSILDLAEVEVGDVMIHRSNVETVNADLPPAEIVQAVMASPHTRLPVWRDRPENIIGVVHGKALFRAIRETGDLERLDLGKIAADPWFIPESTDLLSQLHAFRNRGEHFALVVDEYGDLMGIVTLEDILEEIVGDISDEYDVRRRGIRPQRNGAIIVDGDVTIRDLNRQFGWRLPDESAATIAGLVLYESRQIPDPGQVFTFHGLRFEILNRSGNRITTLRITPLNDAASHQAD